MTHPLKESVTEKDHIQGDPTASVTLVEYGNYECVYCGIAYHVVKKVQQHFGHHLRLVYRHFPLKEAYPFAEPAAETAEYAADYNQFWDMHDLLYENQKDLNQRLLFKLAEQLRLPLQGLELTLQNKLYEAKIQKDFMGGVKSGVSGTPTFFVNEQRHIGPFDYEDLVNAVEAALAHVS